MLSVVPGDSCAFAFAVVFDFAEHCVDVSVDVGSETTFAGMDQPDWDSSWILQTGKPPVCAMVDLLRWMDYYGDNSSAKSWMF